VLYLVIFVVAPFAFFIGRGDLHVAGDAGATAANVVANESRLRAGMAAETVVFLSRSSWRQFSTCFSDP
jgi:hypothetical protein